MMDRDLEYSPQDDDSTGGLPTHQDEYASYFSPHSPAGPAGLLDPIHSSETVFLAHLANNADPHLRYIALQRLKYLKENVSDAEKMELAPFWRIAAWRMPAIFMTLALEMAVGGVIAAFGHTLEKKILLASFMPVISSISGNCGLQASSSTLRALATGHASNSSISSCGRVIVKELLSATCIAFVVGMLISVLAGLWDQSVAFGAVTGISIAISASLAGVFGSLGPLLFKKLGLDPAVTAGPFETALQDFIGITTYLLVARRFL